MPAYDLAIAGDGFGGIVAGALLGARGKKVLLYLTGQSGKTVGKRNVQGLHFSCEPALSYGFEQQGALRDFFVQLGISSVQPRAAARYQIALPNHRITVFPDQKDTLEELRREFPREEHEIVRFHGDLHKAASRIARSRFSSFLAKRSGALRFIKKYGFSRELSAFFDVRARYFFGRPLSHLPFSDLVALCDTSPVHLYEDDAGGTVGNRAFDFMKKKGVTVVFGQTPAEILFTRNRAVGLKVGKDHYEASAVLLNTPRHFPTMVVAGIENTVVPVGMARDVLFLPDYERPEFVSLSLGPGTDAGSDRSPRALTLSAKPAGGGLMASSSLLGFAEEVMPFLREHLLFSEEVKPVETSYQLPDDILFHPVRTGGGDPMIFKSSRRGLFLVDAGMHTAAQTIEGMRKAIERWT